MERANDSHMDKYLRKHLRRETPAERNPRGGFCEPHSNPRKGRGGNLNYMQEHPPPIPKGLPIFFTVVLRATKEDLATPRIGMGEPLVSSNCTSRTRLRMVKR